LRRRRIDEIRCVRLQFSDFRYLITHDSVNSETIFAVTIVFPGETGCLRWPCGIARPTIARGLRSWNRFALLDAPATLFNVSKAGGRPFDSAIA
jgi:hypothetical protein